MFSNTIVYRLRLNICFQFSLTKVPQSPGRGGGRQRQAQRGPFVSLLGTFWIYGRPGPRYWGLNSEQPLARGPEKAAKMGRASYFYLYCPTVKLSHTLVISIKLKGRLDTIYNQ